MVPKAVKDIYFPGLWNEQLINGENFQFPWYQVLDVELINKKIYRGGRRPERRRLPQDDRRSCRPCARRSRTRPTRSCDIHLTVNDILSQMVYEGDVDVINDAGTAFTFDSKAGVDWLQMYVDMVAADTVDTARPDGEDDRVG